MHFSLLSRNGLLILGVVISHLLVLLSLLLGAPDGNKAPISGVLMVNLASDRTNLPSDKKSFVPPRVSPFSDKQDLNPTQANETSSSIGGQGVIQPEGGMTRKVIHSPKPHYPLASKKLREQGLVIVRLCVNQQGNVGGVDVYKSSGFISLDHSALKALAQWRFTPAAFNSTSLSLQCFQTPVQFTLEG